ncbi:unnamed protein product [Paramecium octaurelia]|uniref:Protein-tyrosine-phosphatase n=1 Tax=Paramecium octaurelia TaxID=43137 RepID=A0A8S1YKU3_PAROT|nr:unnamed protein product [Paramecium octaurelia]
MQINFCTPQFFFNISQKFPFIVYDFRENQNGSLKNSIHITNLERIETVADVQKHFQYPEQISEHQKLEKLFNNRKRNYNFFVPFDTSDMFSLIFKHKVKSEGSQTSDQFQIPAKEVIQLWEEISKITQKNNTLQRKNRAQTMILQSVDDEIVEDSQQQNLFQQGVKQTIISSRRLLEFHETTISSGPKIKYRSASQPQIIDYGHECFYTNSQIFGITLQAYQAFQKEKISQIFILLDPIQIIFTNYPFLNYSVVRNRGFLDKTFPNEIIEKKLYLGSGEHAQDTEMLIDILGITHVVNATVEIQNYSNQLKYLKVEIYDEPHVCIKQYFDQVYQFIEDAFQENGKVLIHCAQGKSRSACFTVMYLMRKNDWPFEQAYDFVRECREIVCINDGFINQLID